MITRILRVSGLKRHCVGVFPRGFSTNSPQRFEVSAFLEPAHFAYQNLYHATGLSWHVFIPLSTVFIRLALTTPLGIWNRKRSQKQAQLQPLLAAMTPILKSRLQTSRAARDGTLTKDQVEILVLKEKRNRRVELFKKYKCQVWKSVLILPAVQIPIWISMSLMIRAMCGWSVLESIPIERGFGSDSFLWYQDLLHPDPYGVLPLTMGAVAMANIEWNTVNALNPNAVAVAKRTGSGNLATFVSNVSRVGVLFLMAASFQAPPAVLLYWLSSHAFSLVQNLLFDKYLPIRHVPQISQIENKITAAIPEPESRR
jgi:inner membrane protein COX18